MAALCRERGVPASQMFSWKKRLRKAEVARFVAVEVAPVREAKLPAAVERGEAIEVVVSRQSIPAKSFRLQIIDKCIFEIPTRPSGAL